MRIDTNAEIAYRGAILLEPKSTWALGNYAEYLLNRGRCDEAVAAAQQAMALRPYPIVRRTLEQAKDCAGN